MKVEIMIAVLGIICIGALAAAFVLWAKVDELKQKAAEEHANYLAALSLHNEVSKLADKYSTEVAELTRYNNYLSDLVATQQDNYEAVVQDLKSARLCPHNDHVWKDGRCVKCGRVKDA